jgi:hypothetical protein
VNVGGNWPEAKSISFYLKMFDIFVNLGFDVRLEICKKHASDEGLDFLELRRKVSEGCDALQINSQDVT